MAHPEHFDLLEKGVAAWNQWRKEYPETQPDLSEVDFGEANLREANLSEADLGHADLRGAFLDEVIWNEAELADTVFPRLSSESEPRQNDQGADVKTPDSRVSGRICRKESHLRKSNFAGIDLSNANLRGASFRQTHLEKANFRQALLCGATSRSRPSGHSLDNHSDFDGTTFYPFCRSPMGSTRGRRVLALRAKEFSVRSAERSLLKTVAGP
jgi:hypothetical protein